jgi:hypothetical protein
MDQVVLGRAQPCFYLSVWFQRERFEALLAVNTMGHAFSFHGASRECIEGDICGLTMVV